MPFTFSHPAVILPLNYLPKKWFSLTALVTGSIVPDFEYFIRMRADSMYSHTWLGLFWFDLPLALLLIWVYNDVVKDKLIDHAPAYFYKRLAALKNSGSAYFKDRWAVIIISILIGGSSHLIWDRFTHWEGYFAMRIPAITNWAETGDNYVLIYFILQLLSSLIGIAVILLVIRQLPVGKLTKNSSIFYYWMVIIAFSMFTLIIRFPYGFRPHVFEDVIDTAISGALVGLFVMSVIRPAKKIST